MDDVFVVRTANLRISDYVVLALCELLGLLNVLVILYPMYLYEDCHLSSMVRTANEAWLDVFRMLILRMPFVAM